MLFRYFIHWRMYNWIKMGLNTTRTNSELDVQKELVRLIKELLEIMKKIEINTQ